MDLIREFKIMIYRALLVRTQSFKGRAFWWRLMNHQIKKRSAKQVYKMEKGKGLL